MDLSADLEYGSEKSGRLHSKLMKRNKLMDTRSLAICVCLVFTVTLAACNEEKASEPPAKTNPVSKADDVAKPPTAEEPTDPQPEETASPLNTPKNSLTYQMELLKAGNVEKFQACFTERLHDKITAESVAKAQKELSEYTLDDLYASEERGEYQGSETCKVMMKNGRSLTTFVLKDGQWLADTVWFQ
jgi:hypothetical protein